MCLCIREKECVYVCVCRHQLTSYVAGGSKAGSAAARPSDIPSIRIKLQYKTVSIMPLKTYDEFLQVCVCVCGCVWVFLCVYAYCAHTHIIHNECI